MIPSYSLLNVKISAVQHQQVLSQMDSWIRSRDAGHYVLLANVHVVMESYRTASFRQVTDAADMILPDGMPLVVVGRWRGFPLKSRADGPGLLTEAMNISAQKQWRHYFYGGSPDTVKRLRERLLNDWPRVQLAGTHSPPFRCLTSEEDNNVVDEINDSKADVLWVGLGCPKQEIWMWEHHDRLHVPVMLGVGQAFDLLAGVKKHAPSWISNLGLEWLYRFACEPRRLWRRYLINNPWFVWLVLREQAGLMSHRKSKQRA